VSLYDVITTKLEATEAVTNIAGTRIYPQRALQGAARPFVVIQVVSSGPVNGLGGPLGSTRARVQVTAWADKIATALNLADEVRQALQPFTIAAAGGDPGVGSVLMLDEEDDQVTVQGRDKAISGRRQEFSFWLDDA